MTSREFNPGFRLSTIDVVVLLCGISGSFFLSSISTEISFIIAFVVGHFFLFCNVFRISRVPELVWAGTFTGLTYCTITYSTPAWAISILISLAVTTANIILEMRKPSYHGVFWERVNPQLKQWMEGNSPLEVTTNSARN